MFLFWNSILEKLSFSKLDIIKIKFHVLCAMVDVANATFPKNSFLEKLSSVQFLFKIQLDICNLKFFDKKI